MKSTHITILSLCTFLAAFACASQAPVTRVSTTLPSPPDVTVDIWDSAFTDENATDWAIEAHARWPSNLVVVACHGFYTVDGIWLVFPKDLNPPGQEDRPWPADRLIRFEEKLHPGRTLLLLCCNCDGTVLHGYPGVFYATADVFMEPDSAVSYTRKIMRSVVYPGTVGNSSQFIEAK